MHVRPVPGVRSGREENPAVYADLMGAVWQSHAVGRSSDRRSHGLREVPRCRDTHLGGTETAWDLRPLEGKGRRAWFVQRRVSCVNRSSVLKSSFAKGCVRIVTVVLCLAHPFDPLCSSPLGCKLVSQSCAQPIIQQN